MLTSGTIRARRLANALGTLTGEGEIRMPMSDNEMYARIWLVVAVIVTVIVLGTTTYGIITTRMANDIARYAIDRGAWTCGYDQKGQPVCQPRSDKK